MSVAAAHTLVFCILQSDSQFPGLIELGARMCTRIAEFRDGYDQKFVIPQSW